MTLNKQPALDAIEKEQNTILHVADEIWDYAELSLQEFRSAKLYCEVLKQEGFRVEEGVCSIATAFAASFGSGRPHIGILAEYDALSGLSQQGGQLVHAAGGAGYLRRAAQCVRAHGRVHCRPVLRASEPGPDRGARGGASAAVSYTHLTLPTT